VIITIALNHRLVINQSKNSQKDKLLLWQLKGEQIAISRPMILTMTGNYGGERL